MTIDADLGLDPDRVQDLLDRAAREVDEGRLPSCQLALARYGRLALVASFGAATDDSRYSVFSVTKALTAAAVWTLVGDGLLTADTRAAELVPEFDRDGLDAVTLAHLLTHTAGFPRAPMTPEDGANSAGRRARFARWRLDWEPGSRTEYHPVSAHWVVAEMVEQAAGYDFRAVVADRVLAPLGLDRLRLGVPPTEQEVRATEQDVLPSEQDVPADVLEVCLVGEPAQRRGIPVVAAAAELLRYNEPAVRAVGVPGAGAVSTAADVAMLYQAFLHNPDQLWEPAVLADGTGRIRNVMPDPWTSAPANRTLGLVVAGDDGNAAVREFGREAGPRAFGASGLGGQIAWADPDTGLSFCYLTNGLESDLVAAFRRSSSLSTRAARVAGTGAPNRFDPDEATPRAG